MEQSDHGITLELSNHDADRLFVGLVTSDQVPRQLALNASCLAMDVMAPSQDTNAICLRTLIANHSLTGWTAPGEVQENNAGKGWGVQLLNVWNDQSARLHMD